MDRLLAPDVATDQDIRELLRQASTDIEGHRFDAHILRTERSTVVDAWRLANLLYVACTRAHDRLLVTGAEPGSGFLHELRVAE